MTVRGLTRFRVSMATFFFFKLMRAARSFTVAWILHYKYKKKKISREFYELESPRYFFSNIIYLK